MSGEKKYLVPVKPALFRDLECCKCGGTDIVAHRSVFPGIHVMAEYSCNSCGLDFYRDLPVGFGVDHPVSIGKDGKLFGAYDGWNWISEPLHQGYNSPNQEPVAIERKVYKECKEVIILNTLDYLYGHVLLKLYNAVYYLEKHPEKGLIVILPKMFSWIIPKGLAEVWLVDQRLGQTLGWHWKMDAWVQEQVVNYEEVQVAMGYAHPEFADIDISTFTGIEPFPMEEFLVRPPHITFVARQDRIWFPGKTNHFLYRVVRKLGLKDSLGRWWLRQQNRLMTRTMDRILAALPTAGFSVVGLGKVGSFNSKVKDLRTDRMNDEVEHAWCEAYAKSQVVIGIHGSNMLLPTAHAAGCVEILPDDRFGNIVQDVSVRYRDRMQLFLYRFVDEYASPRTLGKHVASMFRDFEVYYKDNRTNIFE